MGLSNEERKVKIMWAVRGLTIQGRKLRTAMGREDAYLLRTGPYQDLLNLIDGLWHSTLGDHRNSAFWIIGGDLASDVTYGGGPWSAALCHHFEANRKEPDRIIWSELEKDKPFDHFEHSLNTEVLLTHEWAKAVYQIYAWTEQLSYALRRYDDKMRQGLATLDKAISDLQGRCFEIFGSHEEFAEAYLGEKLAEIVWKHTSPYRQDPYTQALRDLNFHHDLAAGLRKLSLEEMIELHRWWLERKPTDQNRLILGLRIAGGNFHYDHQCEKLIKATRGLGIRKKKIKKEFAKCKKLHAEGEKENRSTYLENREWDAMSAIHGWEIYKTLEKRKAEEEA